MGRKGKWVFMVLERENKSRATVGDILKETLMGVKENQGDIESFLTWGAKVFNQFKESNEGQEGRIKVGSAIQDVQKEGKTTVLSFNCDGHSKRTTIEELIEKL